MTDYTKMRKAELVKALKRAQLLIDRQQRLLKRWDDKEAIFAHNYDVLEKANNDLQNRVGNVASIEASQHEADQANAKCVELRAQYEELLADRPVAKMEDQRVETLLAVIKMMLDWNRQ